MSNNFTLVSVLLSVTLSFVAIGQEKKEFSLEEAKAYALQNNPTALNANLENDIAVQRRNEVRGMGLPQANITGSFNNFINLPVQVVGANFINPNAAAGETIAFKAGTDYSASGTLQVNQLLFNGSYLVGLKVSQLFIDFQKTLETQTVENVVFNVIQAYEIASVAKDNIAFVDSMVVITSNLIQKQKNYLELGLMKQDDMDQLSYSLLTAKNAQSDAQIQYQNALIMLKMAMYFPMDNEIGITDNSASLMLKSNVSKGESKLDNNINITVLEQQRLLESYNLKYLKSAYMPSLNAFFQHTYNAYRNEFNFFANEKWFPQTFWGLQLNIPLFSGGTRYAKVKQSEIKLKQLDNSLAQFKESLKFQEMQAKNNLSGALMKLDLQQANIDLAGKIYKNAIIRENIGQETSISVTQKYNQLVMAQAQYTAAKISVFTAKLELDKLYNQIMTTNK
jgi:outer membrane protein|tara:strand:+ start:32539 stop:33891 length:1353 start_codon:yes stop_codon:yes gene_type:complete